MKFLTTLSLIIFMSFVAFSQENPVNWNISQSRSADGSFNIHISAQIQNNWYIYGMNNAEDGPMPLEFSIDDKDNKVYYAEFSEITQANTIFDNVFNMNVSTHQGTAEFKANYLPKTDIMSLNIIIEGQICNTLNGVCSQIYEEIPLTIQR